MLKGTIESLSKPNWANALAARMFGWMKDPANQKLLISGANVAKELLLEVGQGSTTAGK
jgi:hypothetical protein